MKSECGVALISAALLAPACRPRAAAPRFATLPPQAFRVEWIAPSLPPALKAGETRDIAVTFRNASPIVWPDLGSKKTVSAGAGAVRLSYRWWSSDAPIPIVDYEDRADLSRPLRPGESATLTIPVAVPPSPGDYEIQFDLCEELVGWFEQEGAKRLVLPVRVE